MVEDFDKSEHINTVVGTHSGHLHVEGEGKGVGGIIKLDLVNDGGKLERGAASHFVGEVGRCIGIGIFLGLPFGGVVIDFEEGGDLVVRFSLGPGFRGSLVSGKFSLVIKSIISVGSGHVHVLVGPVEGHVVLIAP